MLTIPTNCPHCGCTLNVFENAVSKNLECHCAGDSVANCIYIHFMEGILMLIGVNNTLSSIRLVIYFALNITELRDLKNHGSLIASFDFIPLVDLSSLSSITNTINLLLTFH